MDSDGNGRGFVLFYRKFWDNQKLREKGNPFSKREAWLYLFSNLANGIDRNGVPRGEFKASIRYLCQAWNWERDKVHRFLTFLRKDNMINALDESRNVIPVGQNIGQNIGHFTICKYETYQVSSDTKSDTKSDKSKERIKESKKERKIYTGEILCSIPCKEGDFPVSEDLVTEWESAYPGVDIRGEVFRILVWSKAKPNGYGWTLRGCQKGMNGWLAGNFSKISTVNKIAGFKFGENV